MPTEREFTDVDDTVEHNPMDLDAAEERQEYVAGEDAVDVEEEAATSTDQRKRRCGRKRRGSGTLGKNDQMPDPCNSTIQEICAAIGIADFKIDFEQEQFQTITNQKEFSNLIKPLILSANPKALVSKIYPLVQMKFKDFQKHMAAQGKAIRRKPRGKHFVPHHAVETVPSTARFSSRKRTRRAGCDGESQNSDQEFEELMKQNEEEYEDSKRLKERAKLDIGVSETRKYGRGRKKNKQEQTIKEENGHNGHCEICQKDGAFFPCDTCSRVYHIACIDENKSQTKEDEWSCLYCQKHGPENPIVENNPDNKDKDVCHVCKESGNCLMCSECSCSFHGHCLDPPIPEDSNDNWECPLCQNLNYKLRIEKILSWRWKANSSSETDIGETPGGEDALSKPHLTEIASEREFFVKFKYLSYWRCKWLSEKYIFKFFNMLTKMYLNKVGEDDPPICDESIMTRHHADNDPYNLRELYFQYGVRPEWMQIHRIINHQSYSKSDQDYLVKWRDLPYDQSTWEKGDADIANLTNAIIKYWLHRTHMFNESMPKNVQRMIAKQQKSKHLSSKEQNILEETERNHAKVDIGKKYELQPDYITETGGTLHPYQLEGINWLRHCWSNKTDAILADEMGLGKTVQSLTFLYTLMKENHSQGPFLIVAPLSTIINWEREAEQWCPDFYVVVYTGNRDSRIVIREQEFSFVDSDVRAGERPSKIRSQHNMKFHVLLTSYECINADKTFLSSIDWSVLVVDEAHRLKNNQSSFFKNLKEYKINYRVLLTGTPLQNNLEELFHLLNFLAPDRFNAFDKFTSKFSEISKEDQISKLHALLGPHMLRRLKTDVLTEMPPKTELIVRVELSQLQKKYYKNILTRNFEALNVKNGGSQMSLCNIIMELKKCCNHPYLFLKAAVEAPTTTDGSYERSAFIKAAGKLVLLEKMMSKLKAGGHRVLIFSQMTMTLDILEDFCHFEGYEYERIDGTVMGQQRQNAIDRFNAPGAEQFVFLLSTRAGGLGINLATADTVIIYDSDWNPHNDIQAFSRAHRLGQKNKVMIYRFVTKNSVEERITSVAKKKMMLTHLVVRAGLGDKEGKNMSKTELDDVLRWGTEELFKDEEPTAEGVESESSKKANEEIVWDDQAVDFLLDRSKDDEAQDGEKKEHWTNEYLSSFKVATYSTKETDQQPEGNHDETETATEGDDKDSNANYWEKLLKPHYEQNQEVETRKLGKGKRIRKKINYASENLGQVGNRSKNQSQNNDNDYSSSQSDDESEEKERHPQNEVLGFNEHQRKAFYNGVLRWGIPFENFHHLGCCRYLTNKKRDELFDYASLFMKDLCSTDEENSNGVRHEQYDRALVLHRIGAMNLIKKKVDEFAPYNGDCQVPDDDHKGYATANEQIPNEELEDQFPVVSGPLFEFMVPKRKFVLSEIKFNILDGGFTELHQLWEKEDNDAKNGKECVIWNRRHDYWFLAAIVKHGFGHVQPRCYNIAEDVEFPIISEPFRQLSFGSKGTDPGFKVKFLQRRYKLLEQALVTEEQCRRAAHLNINDTVQYQNVGELAQRFSNFDMIAEGNSDLHIASRNGNRNATASYSHCLNQLNITLIKLLQDVNKLPVTMAEVPSVIERLNMTEEQILSRLTADPTANDSYFPQSGPFVTPMPGQHLDTIQPVFNALFNDVAMNGVEEDGLSLQRLLEAMEAVLHDSPDSQVTDDNDVSTTSSAQQSD